MSAPNAHSHDSGRFGPGAVIRRSALALATGESTDYMPGPGLTEPGDHAEPRSLDSLLTPEVLDDLVERVADKLEERVIVELERRGRRAMPEVF